jgi:hypothetical protein
MATRFRFLRWSLSLTLLASLGTLAYLVSASTIVDAGLQAAKAGVVLDAQTRQPLAGVYVVARWLEQTTEPELLGHGGKMQGQCLYRVVVRTDSQGKYLIPATGARFKASGSLLPDRGKRYFWDLYTYSSGYDVVAAGRPTGIRDGSSVEETQTLETIRLAANHTSAEQRMSALADTLARFTCEPYSTDPLPIAQEVYAEAYATACLLERNAAAGALARLRTAAAPDQDAEQSCVQFRQASNHTQ